MRSLIRRLAHGRGRVVFYARAVIGGERHAREVGGNLNRRALVVDEEDPVGVEPAHEEAALEEHVVARRRPRLVLARRHVVWREDEGREVIVFETLQERVEEAVADGEHVLVPHLDFRTLFEPLREHLRDPEVLLRGTYEQLRLRHSTLLLCVSARVI